MLARALAATVLVALTLVACGSNDAPPDAATASTGPAASTPGGPSTTRVLANTATTGAVATPSALQFNVPLVGGGQLDGSTLAGRPIAFWFWAPT